MGTTSVRSFPDLYANTVEFHRALAKIPCIKEIVTTNWDDFFERECHATSFMYEQDMAFWENTDRKVLKLHGSINNPGSIVATFKNYEERYESLNQGLIGSQLKLIIANKKLVFVGYSFGDEDFARIFTFIRAQLDGLMKQPYIVTLDKQQDKRWKELGLKPIYTSGVYFLDTLKHKLETRKCLISEKVINRVEKELDSVRDEHDSLSSKIKILEQPELIYCLSYQDGIIHAFEHFLHHVDYGESLCVKRLSSIIRGYEETIKRKRSEKNWWDVAYFEGYLNGHIFVASDEKHIGQFPFYFDLGRDLQCRTYAEYSDSLINVDNRKVSISQYAKKFIEKIPNNSIVCQHTPFL